MGEQFRGEADTTLESREDQRYADLQKAMDEQDRLLKELDEADKEKDTEKLQGLVVQMKLGRH